MIAHLDPATGIITLQAALPWDGTLAPACTTIGGLGDDLAPSDRPLALALVVPDRPALRAELAGLALNPTTTPQLALLLGVLGDLL